MRWLVRLVTRRRGIVLDPYAGSGTTGMAAVAEGCSAILVEREPEYVALAHARLLAYLESVDHGTPVPELPPRAGQKQQGGSDSEGS